MIRLSLKFALVCSLCIGGIAVVSSIIELTNKTEVTPIKSIIDHYDMNDYSMDIYFKGDSQSVYIDDIAFSAFDANKFKNAFCEMKEYTIYLRKEDVTDFWKGEKVCLYGMKSEEATFLKVDDVASHYKRNAIIGLIVGMVMIFLSIVLRWIIKSRAYERMT